MSMLFSRFRVSVFIAVGFGQLTVAILLVLLGQNLPCEPQIAGTFNQARNAGKRAQYAAALFHRKLTELRKIPVAGRLVESDWIEGMAQARRELDATVGNLNVYENQVEFSVSTTAWIIWLVSAVVALHGIYLILASKYGNAYSP